jgi:thioredoxin-related protein
MEHDRMSDAPTKPKQSSRFIWLVLACFIAVLFWQRFSPIESAVAWETNLQAAMRAAAAEKRPILINFSSPSCGYCRQMEADVFPQPNVLSEIERFIPLKVNAQEQPELAATYGVEALPSFVVTDASGRPWGTFEGYHEPQEFIDFLKRAAAIAPPQ